MRKLAISIPVAILIGAAMWFWTYAGPGIVLARRYRAGGTLIELEQLVELDARAAPGLRMLSGADDFSVDFLRDFVSGAKTGKTAAAISHLKKDLRARQSLKRIILRFQPSEQAFGLRLGARAGLNEIESAAIELFCGSPDAVVRETACAALEKIGSDAARQAAETGATRDANERIRSLCVQFLARRWPDESTDLTRDALRDTSAAVRKTAIRMLSGIGPDWLADELVELMRNDPDRDVRKEAIEGLAVRNFRQKIPELAETLLRHPDAGTRCDAVRGLGMMFEELTVPFIVLAAEKDTSASVRHDALATLASWDREKAVELAERLAISDRSGPVRIRAVMILAENDPETARDTLIDVAYSDESETVKIAAVRELRAIGDERTLRRLIALAATTDAGPFRDEVYRTIAILRERLTG